MRRRLDRERSSFFPQNHVRLMSEKVKSFSRPTVTQKKNKRLVAAQEAINSTRNRISSLIFFQYLLYRRSSILQDIYFLHRFRRIFFKIDQNACVNTTKQDFSLSALGTPGTMADHLRETYEKKKRRHFQCHSAKALASSTKERSSPLANRVTKFWRPEWRENTV